MYSRHCTKFVKIIKTLHSSLRKMTQSSTTQYLLRIRVYREVALCRLIRKNEMSSSSSSSSSSAYRSALSWKWRQKLTFLSISRNHKPKDIAWNASRWELAATPPWELQVSICVPASFIHVRNYTFTSKHKTVLLRYTFPTFTHTDMFVTKPSRREIIYQFSQLKLYN
jgi:hypothetical protein